LCDVSASINSRIKQNKPAIIQTCCVGDLQADLQDRSLEECAELEQAVLAALAEAGPLVEQHEHQLAEERAQQKQKQQHQATLPGEVAAAAGGQAGEQGKAKGSKRAKDNAVQDELQAWVEQKMQKAPPAVAQVLKPLFLCAGCLQTGCLQLKRSLTHCPTLPVPASQPTCFMDAAQSIKSIDGFM
jgi:hypothetical protein